MNRRKILFKTILWLLVGILIPVTITRFLKGLGATTALSDAAPWGLWIAFDVMSGVALAAGGFVVAGLVYIFGRREYQPFARPAILTAFLGYLAVAVGLLYDLGIPLHIWHPIIYPQVHSVLFEVGMCVILYLTVLFLEFCPVILEHSWFDRPLFRRIHDSLKRVSIPLVIAGIVLSTLHQSSLGSLFLIAPYRVHPLWYSPIIWVLFFVSAVGLGLMTVALESFFSSWYFGHKLRLDLLSNFGRGASLVLFFYLGLRLTDLVVRGNLGYVLEGSWQSFVFLLEILLAAIPAVLLLFKRIRSSAAGLFVAAAMTIFSAVGYRFNVSIVAFTRPEGMSYFPSLIEIVVTLGIVASALLIFIFFVENLRVCAVDDQDRLHPPVYSRPESLYHPGTIHSVLPESLAGPRRYSLALVVGAATALAFLSEDVRSGIPALRTPVVPPRIVESFAKPVPEGLPTTVETLPYPFSNDSESTNIFVIDGNRDGRLVLFDHDYHATRVGGQSACGTCHHQELPFHQNSGCSRCHSDMYVETDIFDHSSHVSKLGGNSACSRCHYPAVSVVKSRETAVPCSNCHVERRAGTPVILIPLKKRPGYAAGYMDAMHGICVKCHQLQIRSDPARFARSFVECAHCHRNFDLAVLQDMKPYSTGIPES